MYIIRQVKRQVKLNFNIHEFFSCGISPSQGFQIFASLKCFEVDLAFIMFPRVLRSETMHCNDDQKDNKVHLQIQLPMLVLEVGILDCLMEKINLSQNPVEESVNCIEIVGVVLEASSILVGYLNI